MSSNQAYETRIEDLVVSVHPTNQELGRAAAQNAGDVIQDAVRARGTANIIIATGNSQLTFLIALREWPGIDWSRVNVFHLDEYVGIDPQHLASFPRFLHRHFLDYVRPKAFYPLSGQAQNVAQICKDYEALLRLHPADLCALGIGENGHLAFNDPPFADFDDPVWVKVVELAEASRRQQVGEGHFENMEEVPTRAITLTIPALLAAKHILAIVPEGRKADAVHRTLYRPISEDCPSSLLRHTAQAHLFLDCNSASGVSQLLRSGE